MRLFTGISIDEDRFARLTNLRAAADFQWTPAEGLHITTKFIGPWPPERVQDLRRELGTIRIPSGLSVAVSGFSWFPGALVADVIPNRALSLLTQATENALEPLGVARETRPYHPHITLARTRGHQTAGVRETIASMADVATDFETFEAKEFHLYLSEPGSSGSVYTKLATWS